MQAGNKNLFRYLFCAFVFISINAFGSLTPEAEDRLRQNIVNEAQSYVGVCETSPNCSPEIQIWCNMNHVRCGISWCAIFFGSMYKLCGVAAILSAWSPTWFPPDHRITFDKVQPADAYGIFFPSLGRIGHIGMVAKRVRRDVYGIEGNSNNNGSREGKWVVNKIRDKDVCTFASWINYHASKR